MPLNGWDHVELWVGNAKQAAYYYEHALGFARTAYAGPETGVRDRASYVLEQGDIRLVVSSGRHFRKAVAGAHQQDGGRYGKGDNAERERERRDLVAVEQKKRGEVRVESRAFRG